jgi:hypothetical protein
MMAEPWNDVSPWLMAALRQRQAVQPLGGRREGPASYVLSNYVPHALQQMLGLPTRALQTAGELQRSGEYDPAPIIETAGMMVGTPFTPRGALGSSAGRALPMDDASRTSRARQLGYADEPFYRGERGQPMEYPSSGHWSRDREYATGFARRGGNKEPREFRLNLEKTFKDYEDLTASQFSRLVNATDENLAKGLVDMIAPGKSVEWFTEFARRNPEFKVTQGASAQIRHITPAGFDALDSGRDVRKLTGEGIRLKDAAFDPAKADDRNILATMMGGGLLAPFVLDPNRD